MPRTARSPCSGRRPWKSSRVCRRGRWHVYRGMHLTAANMSSLPSSRQADARRHHPPTATRQAVYRVPHGTSSRAMVCGTQRSRLEGLLRRARSCTGSSACPAIPARSRAQTPQARAAPGTSAASSRAAHANHDAHAASVVASRGKMRCPFSLPPHRPHPGASGPVSLGATRSLGGLDTEVVLYMTSPQRPPPVSRSPKRYPQPRVHAHLRPPDAETSL
jgi:hypothetical protein